MLSDRRGEDAWDNLRRQAHMTDLEDALLGVMAEAQAKGELPSQQGAEETEALVARAVAPQEPVADNQYDIAAVGLAAPLTAEGALADLETFAELLRVQPVITARYGPSVVVSLAIDKAHLAALLRLFNLIQVSPEVSADQRVGDAMWDALVTVLDGVYVALRSDREERA